MSLKDLIKLIIIVDDHYLFAQKENCHPFSPLTFSCCFYYNKESTNKFYEVF